PALYPCKGDGGGMGVCPTNPRVLWIWRRLMTVSPGAPCGGRSRSMGTRIAHPCARRSNLIVFVRTHLNQLFLCPRLQVIAGAGMDVDFAILSPKGVRLITESRRSDGIHTVEPTEEGDYEICFDNSFSRFSEKMVFFEIIVEGQGGDVGGVEEWQGLEEPDGSLLEYKLEDIRESMESLHKRLERSRQMQTVLRAFEARDRNLLEDNLWRVSFWSCASVLVMLCVAFTQVYTVRRLFDDKRRVYT
ncbi:transmembrane emp24 domain-containing protein 1-like, partial [Nothobranchius furzeri]